MQHAGETPVTGARAAGLGAAAFLLGALAAAWYGNEWMTMTVTGSPPFTLEAMPEPDCDPDELEEEGLSLAECHQMALRVHHLSLSSPPRLPGLLGAMAATGLLLSVLSLAAAAALADGRARAPAAGVFAALCLVDAAAFATVVMSGPLVRQVYLWSFLLWFSLHLVLTAAAAALALPRPAARPSPPIME